MLSLCSTNASERFDPGDGTALQKSQFNPEFQQYPQTKIFKV